MSSSLALALLGVAWLGAAAAPSSARETPIAYLAETESAWQVWTVEPDGTGARQVTRSSYEKSRCSWFPDGKSLLVNGQDGRLYRVDRATGAEQRLEVGLSGMLDAVMSPDGRWIAFSLQRTSEGPPSGDSNDVYVVPASGGPERRVAAMRGLQAEPGWSADSRWLYFFSSGTYAGNELWRVSVDGATREQLPAGAGFHFDSTLSARGDLVYSSEVTGDYELWLLRSGRREPSRLTHDPGADIRPSFGPDGKRVVYESSRGGHPNLWIVSIEGGAERALTNHALGARSPAWYRGEAAP